MAREREWCGECTATLIRMVKARYDDDAIGKKLGFKPKTVQRHRIALGYGTIRRNTWAAPLRRWRERLRLTKQVPFMS